MLKKLFSVIIFIVLLFSTLCVNAQDDVDDITISPTMVYTDSLGNEKEETSFDGDAPFEATFRANPSYDAKYRAYFEWRFYKGDSNPEEAYLVRKDEENTTVTFTESGAHHAACYAYFLEGNDTVKSFAYDYYISGEGTPLNVTISASKLEFPNAFSPNHDDINDIYRAKPNTYRSIVSFKATIFNRWGQKLFEWTDITKGWDGTFNGADVKDGVYFVHVVAKGADGQNYDIKKSITLLRGHKDKEGGTAN